MSDDRSSADRRVFDRYAVEHTQFRSTARLTPQLADALSAVAEPRKVIDVGCGEGGTLEALRGAPDALVGFELSHVRASVARDRGHAVAVADGLRLPCANEAFGLVISRHVIEHVPDDRQALHEMHRVLRPGGRLYIETPLRLRGAWYIYRGPDGRRALDPTHVREYRDVDELTRLVAGAGFRLLGVQTAPIRFPLGEVLARPLRKILPRAMLERLLRARVALRVPRYREIRLVAEAAGA
jgi:SAM-dependent methyltransferase